MRRFLAAFCVCLALVPWMPGTGVAANLPPSGTATSRLAASLLKQAQSAFDLKKYQEALLLFTKVTVLVPKTAAGWAGKARSESYLGDDTAAVQDYDTAIGLAPRNATYLYRRGVSEGRLDMNDAALLDYSKAIQLDPKMGYAYFNRATIYYGRDQYGPALADNTVALRLEPTWWQGYMNRAEDYMMLNMWQQAIDDYTVYIRHTARFNCACAYMERGNSYSALSEYSKAFSDYQQAFAIGPVCCQDYAHYGVAAYYLHKYAMAVSLISQTITYEPAEAWPYYYRGLARQKTGDIAGAIEDEQTAARLYDAQGDTASASLVKNELAQLTGPAPEPSVSPEATTDVTGTATLTATPSATQAMSTTATPVPTNTVTPSPSVSTGGGA